MKKVNLQNSYEKIIIEILHGLYEDDVIEDIKPFISQFISTRNVFLLQELFDLSEAVKESDLDIPSYIFAKDTFTNSSDGIKDIITKNKIENFDLFFLLDTMQDIIITENGIKENWRKIFPKIKLSTNVDIHYLKIQNINKENVKIDIKSCLNRLEYNSEYRGRDNKLEGIVYTANLKDIVEIYNKLGNVIFDKNVRYKINDVLEVDSSIKKTLNEEPENFWFFNNGIALLAIKENLSENKEISINYKITSEKDLQIINGAQTVTSAARYYYELIYEKDRLEEKLKSITDTKQFEELQNELHSIDESIKNFEKAFIILRLIFYKNIAKNPLEPFYAAVSTSLNRQKPIQNYDLKYSSEEIRNINNLYLDNNYDSPYFYILKSGETTILNNSFSLIYFAKIFAIYYLQLPGKARNGKGSLITDSIWENFKRKEGEDENIYFKRLFSPFLFTESLFCMLEEFSKSKNPILNDENNNKICQYSKEYLASLIVFILNNEVVDSFSNWKYSEKSLREKNIEVIIQDWIKENKTIFKNKTIDSNLYKKQTTYDLIKEKISADFKQKIKDFF